MLKIHTVISYIILYGDSPLLRASEQLISVYLQYLITGLQTTILNNIHNIHCNYIHESPHSIMKHSIVIVYNVQKFKKTFFSYIFDNCFFFHFFIL